MIIVSRNSTSIIVAWESNGTELKSGFSEGSPRLVDGDPRIIAASINAGLGGGRVNGGREWRAVCLVCGNLVPGSARNALDTRAFRKHVELKHSRRHDDFK